MPEFLVVPREMALQSPSRCTVCSDPPRPDVPMIDLRVELPVAGSAYPWRLYLCGLCALHAGRLTGMIDREQHETALGDLHEARQLIRDLQEELVRERDSKQVSLSDLKRLLPGAVRAPAGQRRRGRPPGSKNKPKEATL
jgi:hypothetical protein